MAETEPLLPSTSTMPRSASIASSSHEPRNLKERLAEKLESRRAHWAVVFLTSLDAIFVLCDIGFDFLKDQRCICDDSCAEDPAILEVFAWFSLVITSIFLLEIPLSLYCFGRRHYWSVEHAYLHLFDAVVISVTFCLEVFLKGREAEIAGLLVLLRLWRLIKLVSTLSVDVTEYNEVEAGSKSHVPATDLKRAEELWQKEKAELLGKLDLLSQEVFNLRQAGFGSA
ncbi:hypothetical protein T439DRAFT_328910 [Meredithblackwellia eburnea MCA 4105]